MSELEAGLSAYQASHGLIGHTISYAREVSSTNDVAVAAGRAGAAEGFVAVAEAQSAGRGRLGRPWRSPAGTSLLVSALFRPPEPLVTAASRVTMVCGLALAEAVREVADVPVRLKWPNDLIAISAQGDADWKKLAGMLTEIEPAGGGAPAFVVVGIGLNVNIAVHDLADLGPNATSLLALTGKELDRATVLDRLLKAISRGYMEMLGGADPLEAWSASLAWIGREVEACGPTGCTGGTAVGVDIDGALLLRGLHGELQRITAGDISLRPAR